MSSQVRPCSRRPPAFGVGPPHCLKKNGTPAAPHASRRVGRPGWIHRPRARPGFAAGDDPPDLVQIQPGQRSEQRLARQEPDRGRNRAQVLDPVGDLEVFDRDTHPHVGRPGQVGRQPGQPPGPFGEDLVGVLRGRGHHGEHPVDRGPRAGHEALWRALHTAGQISGPTSLKAVHMRGQLSVDQLVDRYGLRCEPIRDLIVTYIAERSPSMDYTSISNLAFWLGKLFWADLERHHPGIDSLRLDPEVAAAWKTRVAVRVTSKGVEVPRNNRHSVLACVRAFYLDLNKWACEDPARWAVWAMPCPVRKSDIDARNKHKARVTAKMQARTRTLAEFVPALVATARTRREHGRGLLGAARDQAAGNTLVVDGTAYELVRHDTDRRRRTLARRKSDGELFDPVFEETEAFWAWTAIEVMRLSGAFSGGPACGGGSDLAFAQLRG